MSLESVSKTGSIIVERSYKLIADETYAWYCIARVSLSTCRCVIDKKSYHFYLFYVYSVVCFEHNRFYIYIYVFLN